MNRTLLIVIGIACAVITAAGITFSSYNLNNKSISELSQLAKAGNKGAIIRLRALLNDEDPSIRLPAVSIIGKLDDKESIVKICKMLNDYGPFVREEAKKTLKRLNDKEAIIEIRKLLNNKDDRNSAIAALGIMGDKESISVIRRFLTESYNEHQINRTAALALAELVDKESIPHIEELFTALVINGDMFNDSYYAEKIRQILKQLGVPESEIEQAKSK